MKYSILDYLKAFNRKERFYLIGEALGNPLFKLDKGFRERLEKLFKIIIPDDAFVAMDYHLDWIYASLFLSITENPKGIYHRNNELITANQEDVDLLVAYEDQGHTCLIFLEAKGVMAFGNKQLHSKVERLKQIFNDELIKKIDVEKYYGIISPYKPQRLDLKEYPDWMLSDGKLVWIELTNIKNKIEKKELQKILCCTEDMKPSLEGDFWTLSDK